MASKTRKSLIVYHRSCSDGYLAASIASGSLPGALTLAWDWKDALPVVEGYAKVYFLDCAPPPEWVVEVSEANKTRATKTTVIALDHHQTTLDVWSRSPLARGHSEPRVEPTFNVPGGGTVLIDTTKAGCQLAWDYFRHPEPRPWYVEAVADRDLWTWRLPDTKALLRGYDFHPPGPDAPLLDLEALDALDPIEVAARGREFLEADRRTVKRLAAQAHPVRFTPPLGSELGPSDGMLWEAPEDYDHQTLGRHISEVGEVMAEGKGFSVQVWRDGGLSFRSSKTSPTAQRVDLMAKFFGGGGHPNAAGAKTGKTFTFPGSLLIAYPEFFSTR